VKGGAGGEYDVCSNLTEEGLPLTRVSILSGDVTRGRAGFTLALTIQIGKTRIQARNLITWIRGRRKIKKAKDASGPGPGAHQRGIMAGLTGNKTRQVLNLKGREMSGGQSGGGVSWGLTKSKKKTSSHT